MSWKVIMLRDHPKFPTEIKILTTLVTRLVSFWWISRETTKNHDVWSPKIMKNVSFKHNDSWRLIMINHYFRIPIERGSCSPMGVWTGIEPNWSSLIAIDQYWLALDINHLWSVGKRIWEEIGIFIQWN